jgi:hypothetical protein
MSGESSYFSRFFVKFIEVGAAGLASAICGYLLAHFGGFLPAPAPAPAVQAGPTASGTPDGRRAQPSPPVEQRAAPQRDTDTAAAQPAPKSVKDAKAVPPRKRTKTDTSATEKEPQQKSATSVTEKEPQQKSATSVTEKEPQQKSAEALARAALAKVDANRPPPDGLAGSGRADTPAPADTQSHPANVPPRQADVGPPQPVAAPPRAGGMEAAPRAADVQPQPAEISPATTPLGIQSRPVTAVDPLAPRAEPPLEIGAPQQPPTADQDKGVFSALRRIPPPPTGETPRPPMSVGTASPEIK